MALLVHVDSFYFVQKLAVCQTLYFECDIWGENWRAIFFSIPKRWRHKLFQLIDTLHLYRQVLHPIPLHTSECNDGSITNNYLMWNIGSLLSKSIQEPLTNFLRACFWFWVKSLGTYFVEPKELCDNGMTIPDRSAETILYYKMSIIFNLIMDWTVTIPWTPTVTHFLQLQTLFYPVS